MTNVGKEKLANVFQGEGPVDPGWSVLCTCQFLTQERGRKSCDRPLMLPAKVFLPVRHLQGNRRPYVASASLIEVERLKWKAAERWPENHKQ